MVDQPSRVSILMIHDSWQNCNYVNQNSSSAVLIAKCSTDCHPQFYSALIYSKTKVRTITDPSASGIISEPRDICESQRKPYTADFCDLDPCTSV